MLFRALRQLSDPATVKTTVPISDPDFRPGGVGSTAGGTTSRQSGCSPRCGQTSPSRLTYCRPLILRDYGAQNASGYHHALDLICAFVDLGDLRITHHPLDRIVLDVAVPAEQAALASRSLHGYVRGEALGGSTEEGEIRIVAFRRRSCAIDKLATGLDLHRHVSDHELHALKSATGRPNCCRSLT